MSHRILLCLVVLALTNIAQPAERPADLPDETWGGAMEDSGGGSSYLGVDIADVTSDRLGALKLKEEHGAEVTMVDQDAPAGKAGVHEHDVILTMNGTAVDSAAQLRRMIREAGASGARFPSLSWSGLQSGLYLIRPRKYEIGSLHIKHRPRVRHGQHLNDRTHHRPFQTGGRFSANARGPSWASSLAANASRRAAAAATASSSPSQTLARATAFE